MRADVIVTSGHPCCGSLKVASCSDITLQNVLALIIAKEAGIKSVYTFDHSREQTSRSSYATITI
jgi:hypothetical protein